MHNWLILLRFSAEFLQALVLTVEASVLAFAIGLCLGIIGASWRKSSVLPLRALATLYVEIFRNTPVLLQIFLAYFGLPEVGVHLSPLWAGVVAMSANAGAFLTEILRAGIQAVPRGQVEAARMLGLKRASIFWAVIFPQAVRYVYPPVVNQFIGIVLESSLLATISLPEITGTAEVINSETLLTMQVFGLALVLYLILNNAISILADVIARFTFTPPVHRRTRRCVVLTKPARYPMDIAKSPMSQEDK